ncbi:ParA family protein [Tenacibaculum ovolyticum]|uniref:ParA family protein n=1 Tax=Tenacibaculum ovolyticum TaxID=104270 RepID=UPI0007ED8134|nr:ParA family protein [Tenacibaculum ovolyticum]
MTTIGVFSQKGGIGKSTVLEILANTIHTRFNPNYNNKKVLVIDADFPQLSIYNLRQREIKLLTTEGINNEYYVNKYKKTYKNGFKPHNVIPKDVLDIPFFLKNEVKDLYDFVFIDIVGSINSKGLDSNLFELCDYIVIPTSVNYDDMISNLTYIQSLILPLKSGKFSKEFLIEREKNKEKAEEKLKKGGFIKYSSLKDFSVIFNRIDNNINGDVKSYNDWKKILSKHKIKVFDNILYSRKKYARYHIQDHKTGFKTSIFPLTDTYTNRLTEEFLNFTKK